jgi:hypothetical protein
MRIAIENTIRKKNVSKIAKWETPLLVLKEFFSVRTMNKKADAVVAAPPVIVLSGPDKRSVQNLRKNPMETGSEIVSTCSLFIHSRVLDQDRSAFP